MTFTTAVLVLISLAASDARALHPASAADEKTIQTLLNNANLIQVDVARQEKKLGAAKAALKNKPNDPVLRGQVSYDAEILEDIVRDRDLVRNKAIHRTLTAFGIVPVDGSSSKPKMPSGTAVVPDYIDQAAHWRVIAGDDKKRTNINARGVRIHTGPTDKPEARAATDGWGITIVYEKAFSSPDYLALILSHEKEHFEQYTTKGRGDKLSANEREVEAWRKTETDALVLGYSANDPISKEAKATRKAYEQAVASDKWKQKWSGGLWKPEGIAQATPRTASETADIGKRFDDLSEIVALEIKTAREEAKRQKEAEEYRQLIEELKRQAAAAAPPIELHPIIPGTDPPGTIRAVPTQPGSNGAIALNPSQPRIAEMQLKDIASRACASPPQAVDRELAAVDWGLFQRERDVERYAEGLPACERRVVLRLIELGRAWRPGIVIGADAVRAAAADSGSAGGAVPPSRGCEDFGNVRCP